VAKGKKRPPEYYEARDRLRGAQAKYVTDKNFENKDSYNERVWKGWRYTDKVRSPITVTKLK
jgi:hypothetical protein